MAYIPGFDHDLFVSYARLDDVPIEQRTKGWVESFIDELQTEVRQRLGAKDFHVWMDPQVDCSRPLTPQILEIASRSAMLLVVMSPAYLNSEWCSRERGAFLGAFGDRVAAGSVFVVHEREVDRAFIPPELSGPLGYSFFYREREDGPDMPLTVADGQRFMSRLVELSFRIKTRAQELRTPGRIAAPQGPCVFVARATEDQDDSEGQLRGYLSQAGLQVLPETWYAQTDRASFEAAMKADLARSKAFAQLLSSVPGRDPFNGGVPLPRLQNELARSAGIPVAAWRDRGLDVTSVRADHRPLVESAQACGIEEFKRTIVELARREPPPPAAARSNVMVFVNADAPDRALAQEVARILLQWNVDCYWPTTEGPPEDVRKDLEESLNTCDGMLLLHGAAGANWVRSQLRQGRKILSQRARPPTALAIVQGPPEQDKGDLGAAIPNLRTFDCRRGLDQTVLRDFAASLK